MSRPANRNYGKWVVSNQSPRPLLTIEEEQTSDSKGDPFEKLLKSPLKRDVDFKPLSHWAKKVDELSSKEKKSKAKGLYEFSSPDDSLPRNKKKARKPKPRKKKENLLDNIYKTAIRGIKKKDNLPEKTEKNGTRVTKKNRPVLSKIENKVLNKESSFVKKDQNNSNQSLLIFKNAPIFGLCSTPGQGKRQKLVKPSYFDFVSPITSNITPISLQGNSLPDPRSSPELTPEQTKIIAHCDATPKRRTISESLSPDNGDLADVSDGYATPDEENGFHGFSANDLLPTLRLTPIDKKKLVRQTSPIERVQNEIKQSPSLESSPIENLSRDRNVTLRKKKSQSTSESSSIDGHLNENKSQSFVGSPSRDRYVTRRRRNLRSSVKERAQSSPVYEDLTLPRKSSTLESSVAELLEENKSILETKNDLILRNSSISDNSKLLSLDENMKVSLNFAEDVTEKLSDLPDCRDRVEHLPETDSALSQTSGTSIIPSDSTEDSELYHTPREKIATKRRCSSVKGKNVVEHSRPKRRTAIHPTLVEDNEKSHYFAKTIAETPPSSSSMISSSPEKTEERETPIRSTVGDDEISDTTPVGNRTLVPLGPLVLKGGKGHTRALSVLRQVHAGRLTIHNQSIMMQAPPGRGRAYESFVGNLLESQPGFEDSIMRAASPGNNKSRYSRTRSSRLTQARKSIFQNSILRNRTSIKPLRTTQISNKPVTNTCLNKTVQWRDSVVSHAREPGLRAVGDVFNESRMNRTQMCNVSVCVVAAEKHEPTPFRSAYGIEDVTVVGTPVQSSARDVTLARCGQVEPLGFSEHFNEKTLPDCVKIGEGVYGEVFMYNSKEHGPTVFKVIPIEGDLLVNDEPQKTFQEILSEVVITMELSNLRHGTKQNCSGFVELRKCWCVKGEYPELLMDLWSDYDVKKGSDNDSPSNFEEDQLYIVLELAHGGQDLESFVFQNAKQSAAAFRQATLSLAVAERSLQFEHRDFHWGNVLLSTTTDRTVKYILDGQDYILPTEGVKVTIIDFTLSRMTFEGCSVFNDLSVDPALFTSEGDYQFEMYRMMKEETGNNWELFKPRTNIFWLHYTLDKMSTIVRYKRPRSKLHTGGMQKLKLWKNSALDYASAADLVPLL